MATANSSGKKMEETPPTKEAIAAVADGVAAAIGLLRLYLVNGLFGHEVAKTSLEEPFEGLLSKLKQALRHPVWERSSKGLELPHLRSEGIPTSMSEIVKYGSQWLDANTPKRKSIRDYVSDSVRRLEKRTREIELFDCHFPDPRVKPEYGSRKRFFFLLQEYWRVYRSLLELQASSPLFYRPHPLGRQTAVLRHRIERCVEEIHNDSLTEAFSNLLGRLDPVANEEFDIDWECGGQSMALQCDSAINEVWILLGSNSFVLTPAEENFLEHMNAALNFTNKRVDADWNGFRRGLNAYARQSFSWAARGASPERKIPQVDAAKGMTTEKRARIVELINEARHFRLRAAIDDSDEQLAVATDYQYLLVQLKRLAGPLLREAESARLDSLDVDVNDFQSACQAKAELDALLFDIEEALERWPVNRVDVGTSEKTTLAGPGSTGGSAREIKLSSMQEKEFERRGFKSRLRLVISGNIEGQSRHIVTVGARQVLLPPRLFEFFIRLVKELKKGKDGYVRFEDFETGRFVADKMGFNRAVYDLRNAFQPSLDDQSVRTHDFIQTKKFHVRLSTHPRYVDWDGVKRTGLRKARLRAPKALGTSPNR